MIDAFHDLLIFDSRKIRHAIPNFSRCISRLQIRLRKNVYGDESATLNFRHFYLLGFSNSHPRRRKNVIRLGCLTIFQNNPVASFAIAQVIERGVDFVHRKGFRDGCDLMSSAEIQHRRHGGGRAERGA